MAARTTKTKKPATTAKKTPVKAVKKTTTATQAAVAVPKAAIVAPKATPKAAAPAMPTVVSEAKPVIAGPILKKPELIERVVTATGLKKKDVKPVVEAMLGVLGQALANEETLVLPPLGKVKINRVKELPNAKVMNLKLRQPHHMVNPSVTPITGSAE